jgi:hypothetical protein
MKFKNITVDEDTIITSSIECKYGEYDVLYQQWIWDGITAESLIFCNDDIIDTTVEDLVDDVRNSPLVKDATKEITQKVGDEFTFINFNFVTE